MRTLLFVLSLPVATVWYGGACILAGLFRVKYQPGGIYDRMQTKWARMILGAAVALRLRLPFGAAAVVVAVFAVFHGHAHGAELPHSANPLAYGVGFVVATGS